MIKKIGKLYQLMENFSYESKLIFCTIAANFCRVEGYQVTEFQIRRTLQFFVNTLNQGTSSRKKHCVLFLFQQKTLIIANTKLNNKNFALQSLLYAFVMISFAFWLIVLEFLYLW